jgi:adenylate cyclase
MLVWLSRSVMSEQRDRALQSTEVPSLDTEVGPHPSGPRHTKSTDDTRVRPGGSETAGPDEKLAIGERLSGRYRMERELGEGGMGVVYLATDEQVVGETFAIKVLKVGLDPQALELLRDEVRKTRKLSHPNIVDVHSVNVDGRKLYVLMEYLEGKSLSELLEQEFGRGMAFSHAWPIIEDVGAALGYAHDHNVIHSDLKPANIFLTTAGRTKLLDFGIARVSRGAPPHKGSAPLALTPAYASCEMLAGKEANRRDDVYSFACVIYEMLSGERPFGDLSALEAREAGTRVPPLAALSRGQNAALAKALAFNREARTASVEKLLEGLAPEHPPRRRPVALVAAAVIALVAAAGLTYFAVDRVRLSRHSVVVEEATSNVQQAASPAVIPTTVAVNPPPKSIAVLPFVNMSDDKGQEYFSDGLSEELIDHLVHSADLKVIARTSSFQFKGRNEDVRSVALKLGVTHVLEGSVRKDGQQLRITAQLVRGSDGVHLWSQTYDRMLTDIFKVQGEIAEEVSQALHVALRNGHRAADREPDVQAYNLLLEGRYFEARSTLRDVEKAAQIYERAVDRDPEYALAWARLAHAYLVEETRKGPPSGVQNRRVLDALDHAIRLDPNLVYAYYTRAAFAMNITWDWAAARADDQRIREIDPRSDLLPAAFGDHALVFGQLNRAIELYQEALTRDPLDPNTLDSLGIALCAANRLQPCLQNQLRLVQLHPDFDGVNSSVGMARLYLGQSAAALAAMQREPNEDYRLRGLAAVFWAMGRRTESDAALKALTDKFASIDPYGIAAVHACRREIDDAFRWLNRAYREHHHEMLVVKTDPRFTNLRGDPRFQALLSRMKFADQ